MFLYWKKRKLSKDWSDTAWKNSRPQGGNKCAFQKMPRMVRYV